MTWPLGNAQKRLRRQKRWRQLKWQLPIIDELNDSIRFQGDWLGVFDSGLVWQFYQIQSAWQLRPLLQSPYHYLRQFPQTRDLPLKNDLHHVNIRLVY